MAPNFCLELSGRFTCCTRPVQPVVAQEHAATRGLYVFKYDSELREALLHALFDRLQIRPGEVGAVARSFGAYSVAFDGHGLAVRPDRTGCHADEKVLTRLFERNSQ